MKIETVEEKIRKLPDQILPEINDLDNTQNFE